MNKFRLHSISKKYFEVFQICKYKLNLDRKSQIIRHIKKIRPERILEIGVHKGDFAVRMLNVINRNDLKEIQYTGIDLFSSLHTQEINIEEISLWPDSINGVAEKLQKKFPQTKIRLIAGYSDIELEKIKDERFDLIFIDGGHSKETVEKDWNISSKLLSETGVIFFDDYTNEKGVMQTGFGINWVVDKIETKVWKVDILPLQDHFQKVWGLLSLKIVKVTRK